MANQIAQGGFIAVVLLLLLAEIWSLRQPSVRAEHVAVIRQVRWWMLPIAALTVLAVVAVGFYCWQLSPIFRWGWWSAIGGAGNVYFGQSTLAGWQWRVAGFVLPVMLVLLLPQLALIEEKILRAGTERMSAFERFCVQLGFGLIHTIAGVPLAAALALTVAG